MVRNTRSLVQLDLPPRYAQTVLAKPEGAEAELYGKLTEFLRRRGCGLVRGVEPADEAVDESPETDVEAAGTRASGEPDLPTVSPLQLSSLLAAQGSHPIAVASSLERIATADPEAAALAQLAISVGRSAKDTRLLELVQQSQGHKLLIFVNFRRTLAHIERLLGTVGLSFSVFSGEQTAHEKDQAVAAFRESVPIMLCTESGAREQFAIRRHARQLRPALEPEEDRA